ncbi:MAG: helix-turn-helix domain-containing protein [Thermoanaerobaculia bacterium]
MTVGPSGVAEPSFPESGSPGPVFPSAPGLLAQEVRFSIQSQYFAAADRGEVSRIRAWRIVRGLDQASLASRAQMTQPEISRAERPGQVSRMKGETLKRIAQALQVRIDDLF